MQECGGRCAGYETRDRLFVAWLNLNVKAAAFCEFNHARQYRFSGIDKLFECHPLGLVFARVCSIKDGQKKQVDAGHQAYIVYPVIEESETTAIKAATRMYEQLSQIVFPGLSVGECEAKFAALVEDGTSRSITAILRVDRPG